MTITVRVDELLKMVNELNADGIEYVELSVVEVDEGKCLFFEAYDGTGGGIDYESIDEVKVSATYKVD